MSENQSTQEINEIIEKIGGLNLERLNYLVEEFKKKYNIQETTVVQTSSSAQSSEKEEAKDSKVSVKVTDIGAQKVPVYNLIKTFVKDLKGSDINIIEAKKLAENGIILEDIAGEKAQEIKKQLEEKGAKVEIK